MSELDLRDQDLKPGTFSLCPGLLDLKAGNREDLPCKEESDTGMFPDPVLKY